MRDPFRPDTTAQLLREAQIGLTVVAVVLALFLYVAFYKITGRGHRLPDHVRNAPIATVVQLDPEMRPTPESGFHSKALDRPGTFQSPSPTKRLVRPPAAVPNAPLESTPPPSKTKVADSNPSKTTRSQSPSDANSTSRKKQLGHPTSGISKSLSGLLGKFNPAARAPKKKTDAPGKTVAAGTGKKPKHAYDTVEVQPFVAPRKTAGTAKTSPSKPSQSPLSSPASNSFLPHTDTDSPTVRLTSAESSANEFSTANGFSAGPAAEPASDPGKSESVADNQFERNSFIKPDSKKPVAPLQPSTNGFQTAGENKLGSKLPLTIRSADQAKVVSVAPIPDEVSAGDQVPSMESPIPLGQPATRTRPQVGDPIQADIAKLSEIRPETDAATEPPKTESPKQTNSMTHVVRPGESFWSIAQNRYGDGRYFRALYEHNKSTLPELSFEVVPGTKLTTPDRIDLNRLWPKLCPPDAVGDAPTSDANEISQSGEYVTEQGDTLFQIARQKFGQASRYLDIHQLNQSRLNGQVSSDTPLPAGIRLVLPAQ